MQYDYLWVHGEEANVEDLLSKWGKQGYKVIHFIFDTPRFKALLVKEII